MAFICSELPMAMGTYIFKKLLCTGRNRGFRYFLYLNFIFFILQGQVVNYVSNSSFEALTSKSVSSKYEVVVGWTSIDSTKASYYVCSLLPGFGNAPKSNATFQYPRSGKTFIISQFISFRGYPRNFLTKPLKKGVTYCSKYHVVNTNNNPYAIDAFGMYFGDSTIDTITQCNSALSYLVPQVSNSTGNIIKDTLLWIPVTGTFVASGDEKYMVIGNFKSEAATKTVIINPTYSTTITSDVCIDDVSVIELELPAYAGDDVVFGAGDSIFIGRQPEPGYDELCTWYKLPDDTIAIDTVAGLWVKPVGTETYVVRQEICGLIKKDTVVLYDNPVGIKRLKILDEHIRIFPNPVNSFLRIGITNPALKGTELRCGFFDSLGSEAGEMKISLGSDSGIEVSFLPAGIYTLRLSTSDGNSITKRFIIKR